MCTICYSKRVRREPYRRFRKRKVPRREPKIAAKAIVLNVLSVAAAYGVLVLDFEYGVGAGERGHSRQPAGTRGQL